MKYIVEICTEGKASTSEKGSVLENFVRRFLETQGQTVSDQVRLTGMEVDLLCKDQDTSEITLVECKAYRNPLSADAISKLLGNVMLRNASAGWLISTHDLTKDGKGIKHDWENKPADQKRKLRIYEPKALVQRLIAAMLVVDPKEISSTVQAARKAEQAYLLITKQGEFWALTASDSATGVTDSCELFHAKDGTRADKFVDWIQSTNTSLSDLKWVKSSTLPTTSQSLENEMQSIVSVPMADTWSDLRPSRPVDFVGRQAVIDRVFSFLGSVKDGKTNTRLFALKAPSGWGKSSTVLKIADTAKKPKYRKNYFIFPVDSRAAASKRFPELALASAIRNAVGKGFVCTAEELRFGGAANFFDTESMASFLATLESDDKTICLVFDQFEELLYKPELSDVFDEMRKLCASVESAQGRIVIGFSWRTDGTITTEHKAYHLWHELEDRRSEIDLPPFNDKEVSKAIGRFGTELGQQIHPQLRRVLIDNCQGYPWLLKKLCVHVFDLVKEGRDQSEIIGQGLNIEELFRKDLEKLTPAELACTRQIARESPAEYFKIDQLHGAVVLNALIQKRLVIRSGTRLTVYWDIFKDYVISEQIPFIPKTYIPQSNYSRYVPAVNFLRGHTSVSYNELAAAMDLTHASVDNLVRDLVNLGHASTNRKEAVVSPLYQTDAEAYKIAFEFWATHEVVRRIRSEADGGLIPRERLEEIFREITSRSQFAEQTHSIYFGRTLRWLLSVGLIAEHLGDYVFQKDVRPTQLDVLEVRYDRKRRTGIFIGEAPMDASLAALKAVPTTGITRQDLIGRSSRNAVSTLFSLGLLREIKGAVLLNGSWTDLETAIREAALQTRTISAAIEMLSNDPEIKGREMGKALSDRFSLGWSEGSQARNGASIRKWARWASSTH
ncbi:restriction endonuclease [Sinirhodobacter sp. HNIBRBA609]|nr:restriction endonuclease [Sinirhodobacter sp. HNIBRBA609]